MAWTQTDAHNLRRALYGLNPRNDVARPSAQDTYECLIALADKASKAIHGKPGTVRDGEREALRLLVDDLYRVEPQDGPGVAYVSWGWKSGPNTAELIEAITDVGAGQLHAREVDDGGTDYIVVISRHALTEDEALAAWEASR